MNCFSFWCLRQTIAPQAGQARFGGLQTEASL
jgi:hypothetical protein